MSIELNVIVPQTKNIFAHRNLNPSKKRKLSLISKLLTNKHFTLEQKCHGYVIIVPSLFLEKIVHLTSGRSSWSARNWGYNKCAGHHEKIDPITHALEPHNQDYEDQDGEKASKDEE